MGTISSDVSPHPRTSPAEARRRGKRWPLTILAVLAGALKLEAWRHLIRNAVGLWLVFGLGVFTSILRTRPVGLAVSVAGLTALIVGPSLPVAIGLGVGLFLALLVLFAVVGTVLMARQPGRGSRPS
jgi:hypothetical protein